MGEQFISDRAKHSRTERCAAFEREIKRRHLFSDKPHLITTEYRCEPSAEIAVRVGERLHLLDSGGDRLGVLQGNRQIGNVEGVDAAHCLSELRRHYPSGGVLPADVVGLPGFDGSFAVRLALPGGPS